MSPKGLNIDFADGVGKLLLVGACGELVGEDAEALCAHREMKDSGVHCHICDLEDTLGDVREIAEVEDVVELRRGWELLLLRDLTYVAGGLDDLAGHIADGGAEAALMDEEASDDDVVDTVDGVVIWHCVVDHT